MRKLILITGGAGFIGSHLCDELLSHGYRVRILDNLSAQVHGPDARKPSYISPDVQFVKGSVSDPEAVKKALRGVTAVFHFAASVGVGQSMYQIHNYTRTNNLGTAVLLESLIERNVERLIVASSMSVYGEGLYSDAAGSRIESAERTLRQLKAGLWEPLSLEGTALSPLATPETKPPSLASVYALSKYDQERMCMMIGRAYAIPTVALRFFNVYGSRQALSNPYTGVMAIFASRLLNNRQPVIFEDGFQKRDFVSVFDVVKACRLALETQKAAGKIFNIGSGNFYTVSDVASSMSKVLGKEKITPLISKKYRVGDIRHCFADISLARKVLGYKPSVTLEKGLIELAGWLEGQIANDRVDMAHAELVERGLTV